MRIPAAISLLLIVVAALIGWRDHRELKGLHAENHRLTGEANAMGIEVDDPGNREHRTKRERADKLEEARTTALDIIELASKLERLIESGDTTDIATQDQILMALERIGSFDADQLRVLIECFRDADGFTEKMHGTLFSLAAQAMIERNPKEALGLLSAGQSLPAPASHCSNLVSSSLSKWSESDPKGALAWVRANKLDFISRQAMETALIRGAARTDLRLAAGWVSEFGISDKSGVVTAIAANLDSPSQRADLLRLLRSESGAFGEKEINVALTAMAKDIGRNGHDEAARWIKENGFSEAEITKLIAGGMISASKGSDLGRWVEWMGVNLTREPRERYIGEQVSDWTKKDHRAAGEWLAALQDGPAKPVAVAAFAKTVAPYAPDVAAQWAMMLPPGNQRDVILDEVARIQAQDKTAE
ncbi:MAG: hypothetical protein RLZZ505_1870 [Verrucomicrobiota bacterium]|jgi:hypothetical protein